MKHTLLAITLLLVGWNSNAQSTWYDLQPNDTVYGTAAFNDLTVFKIYQFNTQPNSIILKWEKISESYPAGWDFSICDLGTCYPGLPVGATMYPVAPGDSGFLGWNVMPNEVAGIGVLRMYVYEETHPDDGDTLTWIVSTPDFNGITDVQDNALSVYPIPASNVVTVNSKEPIERFELVALTGQMLRQWNDAAFGNDIDLSALAPGVYWLRVQTASGAMLTKRLIIAR